MSIFDEDGIVRADIYYNTPKEQRQLQVWQEGEGEYAHEVFQMRWRDKQTGIWSRWSEPTGVWAGFGDSMARRVRGKE